MKTLTVIGRRWFQRTAGNTYHTVRIIVDGAHVHTSKITYGYEAAYEQTAADWLESQGLITLERYPNGGKECLWRACERLGIAYTRFADDVSRKKDL